ncbi:MAG: DUF1573 domain-containing protein [Gemmatales bacterium]|nr:DUF1573 domain-containing protein [Gemmatales bacterium]MCS7160350.1 DUF1573 domain-containing protein [Gemmatales bacterium]MDW8175550.1 DUF1573 domain-containing protein [Gemmatales bacterium]MDW8222003.1 DUF1573 domain-containing protein [Gemmatales bacterium]
MSRGLRVVHMALAGVIILTCSARSEDLTKFGTSNSAKSVASSTHKDFGSVPRGIVCLHQFTLHNPFDRPIRIASVRTSCACATAQVDRQEIAPGATATLSVSVDTGKYLGQRVFTIFVLLEQPVVQELQFLVQAESREDITLSPNQLAFGRITRGQAAETSVTITRYSVPNWQIVAVENDNAYIEPQLTELRRDTGQVQYRLNVRLRPDVPVGSWYAELGLRANDGSRILVPLTVEVEAALVTTPKEVHLGRVAGGVQIERRIIVRGPKPFRILKVSGDDPNLEFVWQPDESRTTHLITIRYRTPTLPGEIRHTIRILTDLPTDNTTEVRLQGTVQ